MIVEPLDQQVLPDLPLSAALGALLNDAAGGPTDVRRAFRRLSASGFRHVQLPATRRGLRPRDLDRSARRDLLATLRRNQLTLSGLDLWVPVDHFTDPAHVDRAVGAVIGAVELAGDLGRVPVSLALPYEDANCRVDRDVVTQIRCACESHGVFVAVHRPDTTAPDGLGLAFDPAACFWSGGDPVTAIAAIDPERLISVRLTDVDAQGLRVCPGSGRLDLLAFRGTLVTIGYERPVVLDLKQVTDAWQCLAQAWHRWEQSGLAGAPFL